jgi:hypothetical protein
VRSWYSSFKISTSSEDINYPVSLTPSCVESEAIPYELLVIFHLPY